MRGLDEKALEAREKKAKLGVDINLGEFPTAPVSHDYLQALSAMSEDDQKQMILAGVDTTETERSGSFVQKDSTVIHARSKQEGLEIIPIKEALEKHEWVRDHCWKLVNVDTDKYTARAQLDLHDGYVIRALPGSSKGVPDAST